MLQEEEKSVPRLRTLQSDSSNFMRERNISQLDIASSAYINQQHARRAPSKIFPIKTVLVIGAVLLVGVGVFAIVRLLRTTPVAPPPTATPLVRKFVSADAETNIQFSRTNPGSLIAAIAAEREKTLRIGAIAQLKLPLTTKEFFTVLGWAPPASFAESAAPQFNALVTHSASANDFALIVPINTFEQALASLFAWERTMWIDWKPFIGAEQIKNISQFAFRDEIIRNNDARVLANKDGAVILGYVIFNKKFVVISTSREALSLILEKLIALPPQS